MYGHIDQRRTRPIVQVARGHTRPQEGRWPSGTVSAAATLLAVSIVLLALAPGAVRAQDTAGTQPSAEIRLGTCDEPGEVAALLEDLRLPPPEIDPGVATSVTDVMWPIAELSADPHVIVVEGGGSEAGPICGPLQGQPASDDGVAVVLVDADGRSAGIAWLRELGTEATAVHVFLVSRPLESSDPSASGGDPTAASPSPSAEPSPSPSPEPGVVLDEEIDPGEDVDVDVGG